MAELEPLDAWPPDPIRTGRLVLREPEARDRAAVIELNASPEVRAYLGGPQPRDELERVVPAEPRRRPGLFVVDLDGAMIGVVTIDRRDADRPGHVAPRCGRGRAGLPVPAERVGTRVRRRGLCGGPRLVRRRAARRAAGALHPDRQRQLDASGGEAGVRRGGALRGVRCRAVVRSEVAPISESLVDKGF